LVLTVGAGQDDLVFALKEAAEYRHLEDTGVIPPGTVFNSPFRDA